MLFTQVVRPRKPASLCRTCCHIPVIRLEGGHNASASERWTVCAHKPPRLTAAAIAMLRPCAAMPSIKTTMVLLPVVDGWIWALVLMKIIYGKSTPSKLHAKFAQLYLVTLVAESPHFHRHTVRTHNPGERC